MGTLHYGASRTSMRLDDRTLAHVQAVITTKLRRNEGLLVHWEKAADAGSGRGAFWIHPSCDLIYEYDGARPQLEPEELDRMMREAAGSSGLGVTTIPY